MARELSGMGIFGYSEKSYAQNTSIFSQRLRKIVENVMAQGGSSFDVGSAIQKMMSLVENVPFPPNANKANLKGVDIQISKIISDMESDVLRGRYESIVVRAEYLRNEINLSRRNGENRLSDEVRKAEEARIESLGQIHDKVKRLDEVTKRMDAIIAKAAKASEAQRELYELEYTGLEQEKIGIQQDMDIWRNKYNSAVKVIRGYNKQSTVKDLKTAEIGDLSKFQQTMSRVTEELTEQIAKDSEFGTVMDDVDEGIGEATAGIKAANSSFRQGVADQEAANARAEMGDAPVQRGNSSGSTSSFQQRLNQMQGK